MSRVPKQVSQHLEEFQLVEEGDLKDLAGLRVGVDVTTWMKQLRLPVLESLQPAMGGVPLSFPEAVHRSLAQWEAAKMTPVFVFQGLSVLRDNSSPFTFGGETRSMKRRSGWEKYFAEGADAAAELFRDDNLLSFLRNLQPLFIERGVQYMVAPYHASPQLAWLSDPQQSLVQAVYAGHDLLPYASSVQKLITEINFTTRKYKWVRPQALLEHLDVDAETFLDTYILASVDNNANSTLTDHVNTIRQANGKAIVALQRKGHKVDSFLRAKAILRYNPILNTSCVCEPFYNQDVPNDLQKLFGSRFPPDIYFCLSRGVISAQAVNPLLQGTQWEFPPLLDSLEYHELLNDLMEVRARTLALLIYPLHYIFISKQVKVSRWFDNEQKALELSSHFDRIEALCWKFTEPVFAKECSRQGVQVADMNFVVKFLLHDATPSDPQSNGKVKEIEFNSREQILAQTLYHTLSLLGVNENKEQCTAFMRALTFVAPINQPYALLTIKLLQYGALNFKPFRYTDLQGVVPAEEDPNILLITRVLSILPMNFKKEAAWHGRVDPDLLAFNSILKALTRSIRSLAEMTLLNLLLRCKIGIPYREFVNLSSALPFYQENSTAMGIVAKEFLQSAPGKEIATLEQKYPFCASPLDDLKRGIQFWSEIVLMSNELGKHGLIDPTIVKQFAVADEYFKGKQRNLK